MSGETSTVKKGSAEHIQSRVKYNLIEFYNILDRLSDFVHYGKETLLGSNNNVGKLLAKNFASLDNVPRGYYEYIENNTLYVYDGETGNPIRKDTAILVKDGYFVENNPKNIVDLNSHPQTLIAVHRAKMGPEHIHHVSHLEGKFFTTDGGNTYHKFNLDDLELTVSANGFAYEASIGLHQANQGTRLFSPDMWRNPETINNVLDIVNNYLRTPESYLSPNMGVRLTTRKEITESGLFYKIPKTWPFGEGMYIRGSREFIRNLERGNVSMILNSPNPVMLSGVPEIANRDIRFYTDVFNSFTNTYRGSEHVKIWLYNPVPAPLQVNLPTGNNKGALLNHSANVLDYKIGFKMTEEESKLQKYAKVQPVMLGIELEVLSRGDRASTIMEIANSPFGDHCAMKSDSSIDGEPGRPGNRGLEIVTIPATLDYHKQIFSENFFSNVKTDKKGFEHQLVSNNRCGIHVHVGKDCFTIGGIAKFITFLNSRDTREFVALIAGRTLDNKYNSTWLLKAKNKKGVDLGCSVGSNLLRASNSIKRNASKNLVDTKQWQKKAIAGFLRGAVHVGKEKTIEVRIFKATTSKTNFFKKVEFVHALVKFANSGVSNQELSVKKFIEFVLDKTNRKDYPYLLNWLAAKGYITRKATENPKTNKKYFRYDMKGLI